MQTRDRVGASQDEIANVIRRRLIRTLRYESLVEKYSEFTVEQTMLDAAQCYVGVEEIGSSDAYFMVETFLRFLGETI
jgi:hypothetical protein